MSSVPTFGLFAVAAVSFGLMVADTYCPWAGERPGVDVQRVRVGLRSRMLIYRWRLLTILGVFLLTTLLPGWFIIEGTGTLSLILIVGWLFFPVYYHFTDEGVALHSARFWSWDNFQSYRCARGVVQLRRADGRSVNLFLNQAQQQSILPVLRRYLSR